MRSPSRRTVMQALGVLGFAGVGAMVGTDVAGGLARPSYHLLADTISLLAYHTLTGTQDIGLFVLGVGGAACGVGLVVWLPGVRGIIPGALELLAAAAVLTLTVSDVLIPGHPGALQVHEGATLAVGAATFVASVVLPSAVPRRLRAIRRCSMGTAAVLLILAAIYQGVPSGWLGLYERVLVADGLVWQGLVALALCSQPPEPRPTARRPAS